MRSTIVLVLLFLVLAGPSAGRVKAQEVRERGQREARWIARYTKGELPDDLPGVQPVRNRPSGPPTRTAGRLFEEHPFVQVNVDSQGRNIYGDAANEPSIAVDPTNPNRIAIGWRQFDDVASNFRQAGWAYSQDGGQTWTFPGVLEPGVFRSDPILASDAQGTFYYNSLALPMGNFLCDVFTSGDGGMTWGSAVPAFGGDKAWMTVDRTGGVGSGNVYTAWSVFAGCCGNDAFNRSVDGAASFQTPVGVPQTPVFGTMDVSPNGTVYVCGVDPTDFGTFLVARSSNAQNPLLTPTFTTATVDLGGGMSFSSTPNPDGLVGQVNVAVDQQSGNVYALCSVDPPGTDPLDVMFARSTDGGATWSNPVRVNDDPMISLNWNWFGTMSVAPNGRIDVVYNDTSQSGVVNLCRLHYTFSTDGGTTWAPSRPMSPQWNSHVGWPNQNKIGDYYDMVSDDDCAHLAFSMTFHGEQDVYYMRIEP